jgi:hypothetical protein
MKFRPATDHVNVRAIRRQCVGTEWRLQITPDKQKEKPVFLFRCQCSTYTDIEVRSTTGIINPSKPGTPISLTGISQSTFFT